MFKPAFLTDGQNQALEAVVRLKQQDPKNGSAVIINGYAGTGKTTLLGVIVDHVGHCMVVTPTGKAALRVQEATGLKASTIHMWLYKSMENPKTGVVEFARKKLEEIQVSANKILIIDEASMVGQDLWTDIQKVAEQLDLGIVVVGDEFQLPPVTKRDEPPFSLLKDIEGVKVNLTEVTRQALESPIIRASMDIRAGATGKALMSHGLEIVGAEDRLGKMLEMQREGGVILCHKNITRHSWNNKVREALGRVPGVLEQREPLLVLKNNYQAQLFNGEVVTFENWVKQLNYKLTVYDRFSHLHAQMSFNEANISGGYTQPINFCTLAVEEVFGQTEMGMGPIAATARDHFGQNSSHLHANLGYVLTAHKAQGSEWDSAFVLIENSIDIHSREGRRWIYTALTRAKQKVLITYI